MHHSDDGPCGLPAEATLGTFCHQHGSDSGAAVAERQYTGWKRWIDLTGPTFDATPLLYRYVRYTRRTERYSAGSHTSMRSETIIAANRCCDGARRW